MSKLASFLFTFLFFSTQLLGQSQADALQQADLLSMKAQLQALKTELKAYKEEQAQVKANIDNAISGANTRATTAQGAANAAQNTANSAANKITAVNSGGGRSCKSTCYSESRSCVVAWAGVSPLETWSCEASPAGNLLCLCY